ncbi:hypothetical protein [Actinomadura hibisca]|uniref:hypothetical protein n=1 Tax=Actinomadura hibisca TaxID=68565 RepID=UPI000834A69C|nr:hypothetical protein [Actinomadura hibisca]
MTALLLDRPTRPARLRPVTPHLMARQWTRLVAWAVQTADPRADAAALALAPGASDAWEQAVQAAEVLAELESGAYDMDARPWWDRDADRVEAQTRDDQADAMELLFAASMRSLMRRTR